MPKTTISAIAAIGKNRELGKENKLIWRIPDDLKRFKQLTTGHPLILGRKTFESIVDYLGHPLPERTNIVVTHHTLGDFDGLIATTSIEEALERARQIDTQIYVGGGGKIFEAVLPHVNKLCLTIIDAEDPEADSFFPEYEEEFTKKVFEEKHEWNGIKYSWVDLERE